MEGEGGDVDGQLSLAQSNENHLGFYLGQQNRHHESTLESENTKVQQNKKTGCGFKYFFLHPGPWGNDPI